jgi:hypothetical protein
MKARIWYFLAIPVLIGATILLASQPKGWLLPPDQGIWFTIHGKYVGRPLWPEEIATIQRAIDSIRTPPPNSITYRDADNQIHMVSCSTITDDLQKQLNRGAIQAETLNAGIYGVTLQDGRETTEGDEMNIDPLLVYLALIDSTKSKYLEAVLVHERTHKVQRTAGVMEAKLEIEAFNAALAYMDSLGLDTADAVYRHARELRRQFWREYAGTDSLRWMQYELQEMLGFYSFLQFDTTGTGPSYFTSFQLGDQDWYEYSLGTTRPSDMIIYQDYFQLPAGHSLAIICGDEPSSGCARILTLDIYEGQVVAPYITRDFGPPAYPPMRFISMAENGAPLPQDRVFYMLDGLNEQIMALKDTDEDFIPDTIVSTFASPSWTDFESLEGMRGIDAVIYPFYGFCLITNDVRSHLHWEMDPYPNQYRFLQRVSDFDGDNIADECRPAFLEEMVFFTPHFQVPLPVDGDQSVQIFGPWIQYVLVYATDSLGQNLIEQLGWTTMFGVDEACALNRPLVEGEYIIPTLLSGERPLLPTRVGRNTGVDEMVSPLPAEFVLHAPYPNPFNATTTLRFELPRAAMVTLKVYDILGREAAILLSDVKQAGRHTIVWNATDFPSGLYFAHLEAVDFIKTQKLLLIK